MASTTTRKEQIEARKFALLAAWINARNVTVAPGTLTSMVAVFNDFNAFCNGGKPMYAGERSAISRERFWRMLREQLSPLPEKFYHGVSLWSTCVELRVGDVVPFEDETSIPVLSGFNVDDHMFDDWNDMMDVLAEALVKGGVAIDGAHRFLRYDGSRWLTTTDASLRGLVELCRSKFSSTPLTDEAYGRVVDTLTSINSNLEITPLRLRVVRNAMLVTNYTAGSESVKAYPLQEGEQRHVWDVSIDWNDVTDHVYMPAVQRGAKHTVLDKLYDAPIVYKTRMAKQAVVMREAANAKFIKQEGQKLRESALAVAVPDTEPAPAVLRTRMRL